MFKNSLNSTQFLNQSVTSLASTSPMKNNHHNQNIISNPENIQVMIRIKNNSLTESQRVQTDPVVVENNQIRIQYSNELKSQTYSFDKVATKDKDQDYVFQEIGTPVVSYCLKGMNACIFAYGQTGAGKTYTMTGTQTNPGIQPRVLESLFKQLNESLYTNEIQSFKISVSYYEIYNEQINDLISNRKDIKVRENLEGPFIENLTQVTVHSFYEAQSTFNNSTKNRSIAATQMNKQSSRSHSIFTVTIQIIDNNQTEIQSKLNFVDMAGSERQKKTQTEGQRLKEAGSINKSLFEFSKVIADLAKQKANVVFRNSKLTHILKDCLVGNSKTFIICAINPSFYHLDETENTLKFASNAKFIETKPFVNQVVKVNTDELQRQIKEYEFTIESQSKQLIEKDHMIEQMRIHSDNLDEEIKQIRTYFCKEIQDLESEKINQLNEQQNQILELKQQNAWLSQQAFDTQLSLSQQQGVIDNQEAQIKELKYKILKMHEEKNQHVYETEKQKLQLPIDQDFTYDNCTEDMTPTAGLSLNVRSNSFEDNEEKLIQLEANLKTLVNQNKFNKSIQKQLEEQNKQLENEKSFLKNQNSLLQNENSQLKNENKEIDQKSSLLLRQKESLIEEMNKISQNLGLKSQMYVNEIENLKEQLQIQTQRLESHQKENDSLKRQLKERKQKIIQEKEMIIQQSKKISEISQSIISEISQDSCSSIQEISQNQFNCSIKEILQKKCKELNEINAEVIQDLEQMKQQNEDLNNMIKHNKSDKLTNHLQFILEKTKKNKYISDQLIRYFIEHPDQDVNRKKYDCLKQFTHFVFSSLQNLLSARSSHVSLSDLIQNKDQNSHLVKVKEFIDNPNYDMLVYHFKELFDKEKKKLFSQYKTLKDFLIIIAQNQRPDQIITEQDELKYGEYIDLYAETNQIHQMRALIFDEYNQVNLRKSKRSPIKLFNRNALSERNLNQQNLGEFQSVYDEQKTIYDYYAQGKKKVKMNQQF
ncbi:kinesin motor catalytic domain protein (macronuclear) [Tetrahymena thermophila SB210]|uniref:Kinesin motor catalytic domain protein n=1 Tax=Tetrahymena thermophila (strain SB210) TaxID=312017 RepID=A4VEL8_TETTS|nr:kinesin motor catalytic domain protein [Tetrahymena thermophila SB210]EDK31974.2 kinesin motor catalytic domain protein [Tetrahymena thermophila SB210]|eukprot:XP_001471166.2 kinesin motor catalytic domain protein [Tetrahymena thermophila SB210]